MALWSRHKFNQLSKGFLWRRKNCFTVQVRAVFKSLQYQYISRRLRRRVVKADNIRSLNAASRESGMSYSKFIFGLNRSNINLDRKILSELAQNEPYSFRAVINEISSQVRIPLYAKKHPSYEEALSKGLLYHGEYVHKENRDKQARFFKTSNDAFGESRYDFPHFMKDEIKKYEKQYITTKNEKKLSPDFYDDMPDAEEDADVKF